MKNKVLAVLLAVCMIAGSCALFASAAEDVFKVNDIVQTKSGKKQTADNLSIANEGDDYNIGVTVTPKDDVSFSATLKGSTKITADIVDALFEFTQDSDSTALTFKGGLDQYYTVSGTIDDTTKITFTPKGSNTITLYKVTAAITDTEQKAGNNVSAKLSPIPKSKYNLPTSPVEATVSKWEKKLFSLTMGLRFYGDNGYKNLNSSEIAQIQAAYTNVQGKEIKIYVDTINDLVEGTVVKATASLRDPDTFKNDYAFSCWVDGDGTVIGEDPTYTWTAGVSTGAIYAVFTELKNRIRINYSAGDHGSVAYQESTSTNKVIKRDILTSDEGQLSVMEGRKVTFVFTPDEGYEVAHVYVSKNGKDKVDVAGFLSLVGSSNSFLDALKKLINATNKDVYSYTFTSAEMTDFPEQIRSIEVEFAPIENFEAPSGLEMPTVEPEGITLGTGADSANGGNGGNGGSSDATTVPGEDGAAGSGSAIGGVVNPATGSTGAIAVFAALSVAAAAAFVTAKKKED